MGFNAISGRCCVVVDSAAASAAAAAAAVAAAVGDDDEETEMGMGDEAATDNASEAASLRLKTVKAYLIILLFHAAGTDAENDTATTYNGI